MNKKYILYLLKTYLPLFVITFFILALPLIVDLSTCKLTYYPDSQPFYASRSPFISGSYTALVGIASVMASAYPLFVESYRFSKKNADFSYPLPFKNNSHRLHRSLCFILVFLSIFSLAYWLPLSIYYIRVNNVVLEEGEALREVASSLMLFVSYLYILPFLFAQFYISTFFVRLGNNWVSSILLTVAGNILLMLSIPSIGIWIQCIIGPSDSVAISFYEFLFFSTYGPGQLVISYLLLFSNAINYGKFGPFSMDSTFAAISVGLIIEIALGALSFIFLYKVKDPSGEYSGSKGSYKKGGIYILMAAMILISFLLGTVIGNFTDWTIIIVFTAIFTIFISVGFYISFLLFEKTPKLSSKAWICFAIAVSSLIIFALISSVIRKAIH